MENKEAAKILFFDGWPQKRIAEAMKVSEKTISSWKQKEGWEEKRAKHHLMHETSAEKLMELINYQLEVLNRIRTQQEQLLHSGNLSVKELGGLLIPKGDIDALQKMFVAVRSKQQSWSTYVSVIREFTEFLQAVNLDLAKAMLDSADEFLLTKKKEL
jgi:hypothetical protein